MTTQDINSTVKTTTIALPPVDPSGDNTDLLERIKEILEVGTGQRGDATDQFVTINDLCDANVVRFLNDQEVSVTRADPAVQSDHAPAPPMDLQTLKAQDAGRLNAFNHILTWTNPGHYAGEELTNGTFETGDPPSSWAIGNSSVPDAETTNVRTGSQSLKLSEGAANNPKVTQDLSLTPGERYRFTGWALGGTATDINPFVWDKTNNEYIGRITSFTLSTSTWRKFTIDFVVPPSNTGGQTIALQHSADSGDGTYVYFDDVSIKRLIQSSDTTDLSHTEIWVAESNSRSRAILLGIVTYPGNIYQHSAPDPTQDYYYWIRSVNWSGQYSTWEPTDGQGGYLVSGADSINDTIEKIMNSLKGENPAEFVIDTEYTDGDQVTWNEDTEILLNGDFELGATTNWVSENDATLAADSSAPFDGDYCLKITENGNSNPKARQQVYLTPGETYELRAWVKAGTEATYYVNFYDATNSGNYAISTGEATAAWSEVSGTWTVPANCTATYVYVSMPNAPSGTTIYYDNISCKVYREELLTNTLFQEMTGDEFDDWTRIEQNGGSIDDETATGDVYEGERGVKITHGTGNSNYIAYNGVTDITPGKTYEFKFWTKCNQILNGDFENLVAAANWSNWSENENGTGTVTDETTLVKSGGHAVRLTQGDDYAQVYQSGCVVVAETNYTFSVWVYGDGVSPGKYAIYDESNLAYIIEYTALSETYATAKWQKFSVAFDTPAGCTSIRVHLISPQQGGDGSYVIYDKAELLQTTNYGPLYSVNDVTNSRAIATDTYAGVITSDWEEVKYQFKIPSDCNEINVKMVGGYNNGEGAISWFDKASLKEAPKTRRYAATTTATGKLPTNPSYFDRLGMFVEGYIDGEATVGIDGNLVVDGTIITRNLDANCVTADVIAAGTITATEIAAGTITANEIAASTITVSELANNSVNTDQLVDGSVDSDQLATNAVTETKITAGAITTGKISAGAITTDLLDAAAVTTAKLTAGAVTADIIGANAVTAAKISAGAVDTDELAASAVTAAKIDTNAVIASKISVATLSAISADMGTITTGEISLDSSGEIHTSGKDSYTDNTAGFWLGYSSGYKFYLGSSTNHLKWDGSKVIIKSSSENAIQINSGGNIYMEGDSTNPATIEFAGATNHVQMGLNTTDMYFDITPDSAGVAILRLGAGTTQPWDLIDILAETCIDIWGGCGSDTQYSRLSLQKSAHGEMTINCKDGEDNTEGLRFSYASGSSYWHFSPYSTKSCKLGRPTSAWDNVYADAFNNVADFYLLDSFDDLAELHKIKGSGIIDSETGLELIDDDTLPRFLLDKDKKGAIVYDSDDKPYISLKTAISHLWGCIKQLDNKVEGIKNGNT